MLSGNHVLQHFNAAGGTVTTQPRPTDNYGGAVYDADPDLYWRLDETSGTTAKDFSYLGSRPGVYGSGVTKNQAGAVPGDAGIKVVSSTSQTVGTACLDGGAEDLLGRGVVQHHEHDRWQDPGLREHPDRQRHRPSTRWSTWTPPGV